MEKTILLRPRLSEKTFGLAGTKTVYVFDVPADANKQMIAAAVTAQFEVPVVKVNIINIDGKVKRTVRKGGRAVMGKRSDIKKAYVTLKEGSKLPFFDVPEDKDKKDKKAASAPAKAADAKKKSIFGKAKKDKEEK